MYVYTYKIHINTPMYHTRCTASTSYEIEWTCLQVVSGVNDPTLLPAHVQATLAAMSGPLEGGNHLACSTHDVA